MQYIFISQRHRIWKSSATELLNELGDQSVGTNVITKYVNQYKSSLLLDEGILNVKQNFPGKVNSFFFPR